MRRRSSVRRARQNWFYIVILCVTLLCIFAVLLFHSCSRTPTEEPQPKSSYVLPTEPPFTIAMDAGHGGDDLGAVGCINEIELTERTIYYLNGWLKNDTNYVPVYCRPDGEGASIASRVDAANAAGAQLLLSVHGNSETGGDEAYGFECYPAPPGRTFYEPSLRFAQLIANAMGQAGAHLRGENGVRYIYYVDDGTGEFVKQIAEESNDMVSQAQSFGLLENVNCPAVLVEQCFLTNADDVIAWGFDDGCARAARIYYESICAYFGTEPIPNTLV